ncbi:MAG: family 43 glycosylhydrolase [Hamadaea sp.]|uniref:family 43 glycosylhydrolase n=1 Tax=Hamadaea sp. TaxID=2024425 RepID=UPI00181DCE8F|nr:family 43 glycosylhydrolase [Hamadaea sp.]NUR71488.1 family 43 glycosylhydrolase [Hamadaea sp.]NUT18782.1 family 43 glycosylhydrolase [Hamadaea sp.]
MSSKPRRLLALGVVAALIALIAGPPPAYAAPVTFSSTLVNQNSHTCADLPNGSTANGTQLILWSCWGGTNQNFTFTPVTGTTDQYAIHTATNGSCVDVNGASTADNAAVIQWTCHTANNQRFRLQAVSGGFNVVAVHSSKCIVPSGDGTANNTGLVQLPCSTAASRTWQIPGYDPGSSGSAYTNPIVWQDFADGDIIRVGDVYYYTASTMHYSPGAPILRSYDLVHWEYAGHAVPSLDFGSNAYNLIGGRAYVKGIWASAFNYRASNSTYYWLGCVEFNRTYVYTASAVDGSWTKRSQINNCYYDAGLLVDDNDTMYVAYGNTNISVAQLSADGLSQVRTQQVYSSPSNIGTLEGSRFYKRNGSYYIFVTKPANGQYILKSSSPWGPYEVHQVLLNMPGPVSGGGVPHQGGLVQTQNGDWYYMAFVDAYPGGRIPVMAPITWTADGWPVITTVNGGWGSSYPSPNLPTPPRTVNPMIGSDSFTTATLGPQYEWNHNPDNTKWSTGSGLHLSTATVTNDLYAARDTLTHRIQGPTSTATIVLNYGGMRDGDRAGLAMLRDSSAWIGVKRDNGATRVVMTSGLTMDGNWNTTSTGTEVAGAAVSGGRIWLRVSADVNPGSGRQARFAYSTDGVTFQSLGTGFTLNNAWQFFMGYRYGVFNYATQALGGAVTVERLDITTP